MFFQNTDNILIKLKNQIIETAIVRFEIEAELNEITNNRKAQYLNDQLSFVKADMFSMNVEQLQSYLGHQKIKLESITKKTNKNLSFEEMIGNMEDGEKVYSYRIYV